MAAPGKHFFTSVLARYWRDKFNSALASELGLKICMEGDLEAFPADVDLTNEVPAVFVLPEFLDFKLVTVNGLFYETKYTFRVVYVDRIGEAKNVEAQRANVTRLADAVVENYLMSSPAIPAGDIPNAQSYQATPQHMELKPPEDGVVKATNSKLLASAFSLEVVLCTNVTP